MNEDMPANGPVRLAPTNQGAGVGRNANQLQGLGLEPINADTPRTMQQAIAAHGQAVLMRQEVAPDSSNDDEVVKVSRKR